MLRYCNNIYNHLLTETKSHSSLVLLDMPKIELVFDERFDHVRCTAVQCTDLPNIMRLMYFE